MLSTVKGYCSSIRDQLSDWSNQIKKKPALVGAGLASAAFATICVINLRAKRSPESFNLKSSAATLSTNLKRSLAAAFNVASATAQLATKVLSTSASGVNLLASVPKTLMNATILGAAGYAFVSTGVSNTMATAARTLTSNISLMGALAAASCNLSGLREVGNRNHGQPQPQPQPQPQQQQEQPQVAAQPQPQQQQEQPQVAAQPQPQQQQEQPQVAAQPQPQQQQEQPQIAAQPQSQPPQQQIESGVQAGPPPQSQPPQQQEKSEDVAELKQQVHPQVEVPSSPALNVSDSPNHPEFENLFTEIKTSEAESDDESIAESDDESIAESDNESIHGDDECSKSENPPEEPVQPIISVQSPLEPNKHFANPSSNPSPLLLSSPSSGHERLLQNLSTPITNVRANKSLSFDQIYDNLRRKAGKDKKKLDNLVRLFENFIRDRSKTASADQEFLLENIWNRVNAVQYRKPEELLQLDQEIRAILDPTTTRSKL